MSESNRRRGPVGGAKSETVAAIPKACQEEGAAVEFLERMRWPNGMACPHCGSVAVYPMLDRDGNRSSRYLWRCRPREGCGMQFTWRVGSVMEDSRIPARIWLYAFYRACASKKGISALQIKRETGLSYKSALFLMHRIRFAMTDDGGPLGGTVETDECFLGGKLSNKHRDERDRLRKIGFPKIAVQALVERGGRARASIIPTVSGANLADAIKRTVHPASTVFTDGGADHPALSRAFARHEWINHDRGEYGRGDVTTNTVEGFFGLLRRRIYGTHHSVSQRHLGPYLTESSFLYSHRHEDDGARTAAAIQGANGRRLRYLEPTRA